MNKENNMEISTFYKRCITCNSVSDANGTCHPCGDKSQKEYIKAMEKAGLTNQNIIKVNSLNKPNKIMD